MMAYNTKYWIETALREREAVAAFSSVYTLRIYMPSDRGQGRHEYVIYVLLYYY